MTALDFEVVLSDPSSHATLEKGYVQKLRDQLKSLQEDEKSLIQSSADELRKYRDTLFSQLTNGNNLFDGLTADSLSETDLAKAVRVIYKSIQDLGDNDATEGLSLMKSNVEELANAILSAERKSVV